jgi:uncharacterized spore protein YtfJ
MDLKDLLTGLMSDMREVADTASMIGEPLQVGQSHMVPLMGVTIGFGTAATDLSGSGAGGTMVVTPRAFVVIGADGVPQMVALKDGKYGALQPAIELGGTAAKTAELPAKAEGDTGPSKT